MNQKSLYKQYKESIKGHSKLMVLSNYSSTFTCLAFHLNFLLINYLSIISVFHI
jgi:hypothetical protein